MSRVWIVIIIWVLKLILRGNSEREAVEAASARFGVSPEEIRKRL